MIISPIDVESRTRFQDSVEIVAVVAGVVAAVFITEVVDMVPVADSVLTGDADCWVHPAAMRKAATSIHASSKVRTGDDIVKRWNDKKKEVAGMQPALWVVFTHLSSRPCDRTRRLHLLQEPSR
jgi:hypothetical protein